MKTNSTPLLFSLLLLLLTTRVVRKGADATESYDEVADQIILHAQRAARLHNAGGNAKSTQAAIQDALAAFEKARNLAPEEPQAFLNAANFLQNINRFDESMDLWDSALTLLNRRQGVPGVVEAIHHATKRRRHAQYGKYSTQRDQAYKEGTGDIELALRAAKKQLSIYWSPRILHDIATLSSVQSEIQPSSANVASKYFSLGQNVSLNAAATFQRTMLAHKTGRKPRCPRKVKIWPLQRVKNSTKLSIHRSRVTSLATEGNDNNAYSEIFDEGSFGPHVTVISRPDASIRISGRDGVISIIDKGTCSLVVLQASEWPYVPLHENVWLAETWITNTSLRIYDHSLMHRYQPPNPTAVHTVIDAAVSLVHFGSSYGFYHFLMGTIPRLASILAGGWLHADPRLRLLVPNRSSSRFIDDLLRLALPSSDLYGRITDYDSSLEPGVRFRLRTLILPDWEMITRADDRGMPTHCLPSPRALRAARRLLLTNAADLEFNKEGSYTVVYASRNGSSRVLDQRASLLRALRKKLPADARLVEFDGRNRSIEHAVDLFHSAVAIVGVHGAALANSLFARPGTLLMEIGFRAPTTSHYHHAALALGLRYEIVHVNPDIHAMSANFVELSDINLQRVADHIIGHIGYLSRFDGGPGLEL